MQSMISCGIAANSDRADEGLSVVQEKPQLMIRPAANADAEAIWAIMEPIIRAGQTYALPRNMTRSEALSYWLAEGH